MRLFVVKIFLIFIFFLNFPGAFSQNIKADTSTELPALRNTLNVYHKFLSPETGLYNGSEYVYTAYYPFAINEGHPYFQEKLFDTGAVFYNNVIYEKVPLMFDLINEKLLIRDPTSVNIITLNNERIMWFIIRGHTFVKLHMDSVAHTNMPGGFYDLLYSGATPLYKKMSKRLMNITDTYFGVKQYVTESNDYFIKKNNQYYKITNKKGLLHILNNKTVAQFIRKNKLSLKSDKDDALKKIVAYYDSISSINIKSDN